MLIYLELLATPEEKDKFQALYERYYGLLLHIANQILRNHHDAEDATQEAFLAVVKNLEKISEVGCPKTGFSRYHSREKSHRPLPQAQAAAPGPSGRGSGGRHYPLRRGRWSDPVYAATVCPLPGVAHPAL